MQSARSWTAGVFMQADLTFSKEINILKRVYAVVVELADTTVLGAVASVCRFESCQPHQKRTDGFIWQRPVRKFFR